MDTTVADEYETFSQSMCDKIYMHVNQCQQCQRRYKYDPVEKALLKTHSIKNEIMELLAFALLGLVVIVAVGGGRAGGRAVPLSPLA